MKIGSKSLEKIISESIKKHLIKEWGNTWDYPGDSDFRSDAPWNQGDDFETPDAEIFTIEVYNISSNEEITDNHISGDIYYSLEDAIEAARKIARKYINADEVIETMVLSGEYEKDNGEIYGEPDVVYVISNSDKRTTMIARKNAGYTSLEVDEYMR